MTATIPTIREKEFSEFSDAELIAYYTLLKLIPFHHFTGDEYSSCLEEFTKRRLDTTNIVVKDLPSNVKEPTPSQEALLHFRIKYFEIFHAEEYTALQDELKAEEEEKARKLREKEERALERERKRIEREQQKKIREEEREKKRIEREEKKKQRELEKQRKAEEKLAAQSSQGTLDFSSPKKKSPTL